MKIGTIRNNLGQIINAADLVFFLPAFALLFAVLFNVSIMMIYQQRCAFLACMASWYDAIHGTPSPQVSTWINDLHLPAGTGVSYNPAVPASGAFIYGATVNTSFNAMGFFNVNLSDIEASMRPPF